MSYGYIIEQIRADPQPERILEWTEYLSESTERIAPTAWPVGASLVEIRDVSEAIQTFSMGPNT